MANIVSKEAIDQALKEIDAKKEALDKQIDEEIEKAEKEISVLKKSAPEKINKIAKK